MNSCDDSTCGSSGGTTRQSRIPRSTGRSSAAHQSQNASCPSSQGLNYESRNDRRSSFPPPKTSPKYRPCPASDESSSVGGASFLTRSQRRHMRRQLDEIQEYYRTPLSQWQRQNARPKGSSGSQISPGTTCPGTSRRQSKPPASPGRQPASHRSVSTSSRAQSASSASPRQIVCPASPRARSASPSHSRTRITSRTQSASPGTSRPRSSLQSSTFRSKQASPRTTKNISYSSEDDVSFEPPLFSSTMREPQTQAQPSSTDDECPCKPSFVSQEYGRPGRESKYYNPEQYSSPYEGYTTPPASQKYSSMAREPTKVCFTPNTGYFETSDTSGDDAMAKYDEELIKKALEVLSGDDPSKIPSLNLDKSEGEEEASQQKNKSNALFKSFMRDSQVDSSQSQSGSSRSSPQQPGATRGSSSSPRGSSGSPRGTSSSQGPTSSDDRPSPRSQSRRSQVQQPLGNDETCICAPSGANIPPPGPSCVCDVSTINLPDPIPCPAFPVENWQKTEEDVTEIDLDLEKAMEEEVRRVREALGPDADQFELMEALCAAGVPEVVIEREMANMQDPCNMDSEESDDLNLFRKVEDLIDEETREIETALMLYRDEIEERRRRGDDFGIVPTLKLPEKRSTYSLRRQLRQMHKQVRPFTIIEGDEPEDIHPDVAAAMMHTEEIGLHLGDAPEKMYSYLFRTKYSGVSKVDVLPGEEDSAVPGRMTSMADGTFVICDAGGEDIEKPPSTEVYSKTVGSPPEPVEVRESAASVSSELGRVKDYFLEASAPAYYTRVQLRGSVTPDWFPGYMESGTLLTQGEIRLTSIPSRVLNEAWSYAQPDNFQQRNVRVIAEESSEEDEVVEEDGQEEMSDNCPCKFAS